MHLPLLSGTILRHTYGGWARGHAFARARSAGQPIGFRETAHERFSGPAVHLAANRLATAGGAARAAPDASRPDAGWAAGQDRKSTRLNSSHVAISYAVFRLKKKNTYHQQ